MRKKRILSIISFSLLFAYELSFVFESPAFYSLAKYYNFPASSFALTAVLGVFLGLFSCGFFVDRFVNAKTVMLWGIGICVLGTLPFFFPLPHSVLLGAFVLCALASGYAIAAWGYFLKFCNRKEERLKVCADVLIYSNILLIPATLVTIYLMPLKGVALCLFYIVMAGVFTWFLPEDDERKSETDISSISLKMPLLLLFVFVVLITINSGLMYQVFNPSFSHLTLLTALYWVVPYVVALAIMRNLPIKIKRSWFLYVGILMIMLSFVAFMFVKRDAFGYLVVNTLMLGACGIFDLFWWSILGETLDYTENPVRIFGLGLSANVLGVLLGGILGYFTMNLGMEEAHIAVIAISILALTLIILPHLNTQLLKFIKNHAYLIMYSRMPEAEREAIINTIRGISPLTEREREVLALLLDGKSNRSIAETLHISENTVKTHVKNIFGKYEISSRAELISILLKEHI